MGNFYSELAFDEKNVAVTLTALDAKYRDSIRVLLQQIGNSEFFERHPAFLELYDGVSVSGWRLDQESEENRIAFDLRFTDPVTCLSVVFNTWFNGDDQSIDVYLFDRSGRLDKHGCHRFLEVSDYCKRQGIEFSGAIGRDKSLTSETGRIVSQCVGILENDLVAFLDGRLRLADTNLRDTTVDELKIMLQSLSDIDVGDIEGQTLLCHAVRASRPDLVECLLQDGADPNCRALYHAARLDAAQDLIVALMELLLKAGADPDRSEFLHAPMAPATCKNVDSPIFVAAGRGHGQVVRCLLSAGACGKEGESFSGFSRDILQILGSGLGRFRVK